MNRTISAIIAICATAGLGMVLIWMHASLVVWIGIGLLGGLAARIYALRNCPPEVRRRELWVLGAASAFLVLAYVFSTVRPP